MDMFSACVGAAVLAGVALHLGYFMRGEHHMYGLAYAQGFLLLLVASTAGLVCALQVPPAEAVSWTASLAGALLLGLYGSLVFYRLAWHPLRGFPGPALARVSSLWWTAQVAPRCDAHVRAAELYRRYGAFVRVGSSDLMLAHPLAVPAVHGAQSGCRKASWYDEDWPRESIHVTRNHAWHHERRRVWSQAFSDRALRGYESRIAPYTRALVDRLAEFGGQPCDAARWFNYFSFDVMGDLSFGRDFGCLRRGEQHWAVALLDAALGVQGLKLPTWLFRVLIAVPGLTGKYWRFIGYCDAQMAAKRADYERAKRAGLDEEPCLMASLLAHAGPEPSPADSLHLQSDARTIIVAGSDTTAATLSHVFYHLARHPEHVARLRDELRPLRGCATTATTTTDLVSFEHARIYQAEHLNAVINETLRLHPVPPTAIVRKTPPEGIVVDGTFVPGAINVWTPAYVIGRSEAAYQRPDEFLPERWTSRPEMVREKAGYAPFLTGPYGCIGRPLALMQLRLAISEIIFRFDVEFGPGKDGSEFIHNVKDRFTWGLPELSLRFRSRTV